MFDKKKKRFENTEFEKGFDEIEEILNYLKGLRIKNIGFNGALARGLSYYTGAVFEVFLKNSEIKSSVAGGGRYDEMIGKFLEGKRLRKRFIIVSAAFPDNCWLMIDSTRARK